MTEDSVSMWSGYCGDAIRLRNHRTLVRAIWLIAIGLLFIWVHPRMGDLHYWISFFHGARPGDGGYFLDKEDRSGAYLLLFLSAVFLSLGVYTGWLYGTRRIDFKRHPFARKLALRGPIEEIVAEIDAQFAKSHERFGAVRMTAGWLLHETRGMVTPMRLEDVSTIRQYVVEPGLDPILHAEIRDLYGDSIKPLFGSPERERKFMKRMVALVPDAVRKGI